MNPYSHKPELFVWLYAGGIMSNFPDPNEMVKSTETKQPSKSKAAASVGKSLKKQEATNIDTRVKSTKDTIRDLLMKNKKNLAMALPKHLTANKLIGLATTTLSANPALLDCIQSSLLGSIIQVAQLGLELNKSMGHVSLVPYGKTCTVIVGYQGLIELSRRSGLVSFVKAAVVREGDFFEYEYGMHQDLKHKPKAPIAAPVIYAYAYAKMKDGEFVFDVMEKAAIDKIRARAKQDHVWKTDYDEMAKKTIIRRLSKILPKSVEFSRGIELDGTDPANLDVGNINPETGEFLDERNIVHEAEVIEEQNN